jgi:L-gulonolactone oxidase
MVDSSKSVEIMKKIERMITEHKICLNMPIEIRFTRADDVPLSPMYQRDSTCFTFLLYNLEDQRVIYFEQLDKIFAEYGGRPHW